MTSSAHPEPLAPVSLVEAVSWLRAGHLLVIPTETFYALTADPRMTAGVQRLREIKQRPADQPLPLLAGSREQVKAIAPLWETHRLAAKLADAFWPGPLSLVFGAPPSGLADGVAARDQSVAVRWTPDPVAGELARLLGYPLISTSANVSGAAPPTDIAQSLVALPSHPQIRRVDDGPRPGGAASTIVDARKGACRVVREGAIAADDIARVLAE